MSEYNWKQFIKRVTIHSSPESIYNAGTTQHGLESWFLRLAEFKTRDGSLRKRSEPVQKGDRYKWLLFGYDDTIGDRKKYCRQMASRIKIYFFGRLCQSRNQRGRK